MRYKYLVVSATTLLIFLSCGQNKNYKADNITSVNKETPAGNGLEMKKEIPVTYGTFSTDSAIDQVNPNQQQPKQPNKPAEDKVVTKTDWDKKIIKTGTLRLEVKDFNSFNQQFRKNVKDMGGYVAGEEQNKNEYELTNTVTVKIPVDKFDDLMNQLPGADTKTIERKISTEDVSTEYVDTKARLEARKQVRLKYLDLLKQAKNMEEILQVQSEINSIQEEIESASSRTEYLSRSASFSTVNLSFYQLIDGKMLPDTKTGFLAKLANSFNAGLQWFGEALVGLVSLWPALLILVILWISFRKFYVRPGKHQKVAE